MLGTTYFLMYLFTYLFVCFLTYLFTDLISYFTYLFAIKGLMSGYFSSKNEKRRKNTEDFDMFTFWLNVVIANLLNGSQAFGVVPV